MYAAQTGIVALIAAATAQYRSPTHESNRKYKTKASMISKSVPKVSQI